MTARRRGHAERTERQEGVSVDHVVSRFLLRHRILVRWIGSCTCGRNGTGEGRIRAVTKKRLSSESELRYLQSPAQIRHRARGKNINVEEHARAPGYVRSLQLKSETVFANAWHLGSRAARAQFSLALLPKRLRNSDAEIR